MEGERKGARGAGRFSRLSGELLESGERINPSPGSSKANEEQLLLDFTRNQIACGAWYVANFQALPLGILIW